jgi:hypothetical protein
MSTKEIKIQQYLNIVALEKGFQSDIKLFKHSLFDLSKCFLKWLKVKCFDNLILDLSNGHNLCYMSFIFWKCDLILSITFQKKIQPSKEDQIWTRFDPPNLDTKIWDA